MSINVKQTFQFLIDDFGYKYIGSQNFGNIQALSYINESANIQLEIAYSDGYFHCEIRRIINGTAAKYNDSENCISHEDLAIFESKNKYEHLDYFAGGKDGLNTVVKNVTALFKRNKALLADGLWIDTAEIKHMEDLEFFEKFGHERSNKPSFFDLLREEAIAILKKKGYAIIKDSKEGAPYDPENRLQHIVFFRLYNKILISQLDWRDDYNTYYISRNNKNVLEVNVSAVGSEEALKLMTKKLLVF